MICGGSLVQFIAFDIGHHIISCSQFAERCSHRHDMGVEELREQVRLTDEALQCIPVLRFVRTCAGRPYLQAGAVAAGDIAGHVFLDDNIAVLLFIVCEIGDAEPALPELADNSVASQSGALRQTVTVKFHISH